MRACFSSTKQICCWIEPQWTGGSIKTHLVAKGYTQVYGLDCSVTFSPVVKMASNCVFLDMASMKHYL
ncbi:hypothetical protein CR513_43032, partial [Mucuna pruriens]